MKVKTGEIHLDVHVDDHVKVVEVGDNVRITIHGDFGQEVVIKMPKDKYEEDMAPTWDFDDDGLAGFIEQVVKHLLHGKQYTNEIAAEVRSQHIAALLTNEALQELKETVPAKALADYIKEATKALGAKSDSAKEEYITALLCNPGLCKMIMEV